jgi:rfaE bifunctional protein kinase chain/domain
MQVLVVGDVMLDRYLIGHAARISPEAPVPVVDLEATEDRLGGAANVALNLRALGATVHLCSVVGMDADGEIFRSLLDRHELPADGLLSSGERVTTVKTRVIASHQQLLRLDREHRHDLPAAESASLLGSLRRLLDRHAVQVILLQDYNKGVLTAGTIRTVMEEASRRQIPTAIDPKRHNFWEYREATLFKPNLKEVRDSVPMRVELQVESLWQASQYIRRQLANRYTMITLSEKGIFIDDSEQSGILATHPRNVADVSGAGDTVISVAALGLAQDLDLPTIAQLANLAGGQVCEKVGVVPVDPDQLRREFLAMRED